MTRVQCFVWVVLAVLAASVSVGFAQGGSPAATVVLDAARTEPVEVWREVTGELRAVKRAAIASRQAGLVIDLDVEEGQRIEAGQVLARLDDVLARLEADEKRAAADAQNGVLRVREAELEKAQRDWARYENLVGKDSVSPAEIDVARTGPLLAASRVEEAKGDVASAMAAVAVADQTVREMILAAPFSGFVVRKRSEVGEWVVRGGPVLEVVSLDQLEARLDVPESLVPGLVASLAEKAGADGPDAVGASVKVRVLGLGTEIDGVLDAVFAEADPLSRLVPIRVSVSNADGVLRPGMSILGLVKAAGSTEPRLTVSKDAIQRDDAGEFVYFDAGGTAAVARVRSRFATGDRMVIDGNLPPGAMLVVKGNERLFPGQPLKPE